MRAERRMQYSILRDALIGGAFIDIGKPVRVATDALFSWNRARAGARLACLLIALIWGLVFSGSTTLVLSTPLVFFGSMLVLRFTYIRRISDRYHRTRQLVAMNRIARVLILNAELHKLQESR